MANEKKNIFSTDLRALKMRKEFSNQQTMQKKLFLYKLTLT